MLRMLIKAYYVNVVVYIQPIYLNKHAFSRVSLWLSTETIIFYCKEENVHESEIQKSLNSKRSIFRWRTVLESISKSCTWWVLR